MSFFYNVDGDDMKIYVDLVLLLNFAFDFILLLSVSVLLRRMVSINRLLLGGFVGSLSILLLFTNINSITLFFLKLFISVVMLLVSFGYKSRKHFLKNMVFLYMASIVLGGFLYFLNIQFSYKNEGLVFFHDGLSINFIFLIIFSPIIIYIYVKQGLNLKHNYSKYHKINMFLNNKNIDCIGYVDTGNKVRDPYLKRRIIFINNNIFINSDDYVLVPVTTIRGGEVIKCFKIDKVLIDGKELKERFLVSLMEDKIKIDGVSCILPEI